MQLPQKVLLNTLVQVAGRLVALTASVVVLRLTTGYLGIERFGELSIVLAFALVLAIVADLGIPIVLARELARAPDRADELGATLLTLRLVGSLVLFALFLPLVWALPYAGHVKLGLVLAAAGVVAGAGGGIARAFFQVHLRLEYAALLDALAGLLSIGLVALVVSLDLGFLAVVGVSPAVALATAALGLALTRRFWRVSLRPSWRLARPLARDAAAIGVVSVLGFLHFRVDSIMLSVLRPASDVGIYAVSYAFLEQALVLPALFMGAVFPILVRLLEARSPDAEDVIRRSLHFLVLLALPLAIAAFALAPTLVRLVAGGDFESAATPLRILAPALVFAFANTIFAAVLLALNRRRALIVASLLGLAVNVLLNLAAIPAFGYVGAAATTVASELFGLVLVATLAYRAYPFRLRFGFVARLAPAALAMGALLALAPAWPALVPACAAFAAVAYGSRAVTRSDLRLLLGR
jgi:O-antigen/teichoic acid export membrane protein